MGHSDSRRSRMLRGVLRRPGRHAHRRRMDRGPAQRRGQPGGLIQREDARLRERQDHPACRVLPAGPGAGDHRPGERIRAQGHRGHRGRALLRARGRRPHGHRPRPREQPLGRRPGRRVHHHAAARARHAAFRRGHRDFVQAQDPRGAAGPGDGEGLQQRRHPHDVPEHHQLRRRLLRHRGGRAALLPEVGARPDHRRGGHARRHPPIADVQQPGHLSREQPEAPQHGARPHVFQQRHHEGRTRRGAGRAPDAQPGAHALGGRHLPVSVLHQLRAPAAARKPVVRPGVRRRADRVHHHRPHAAGICRAGSAGSLRKHGGFRRHRREAFAHLRRPAHRLRAGHDRGARLRQRRRPDRVQPRHRCQAAGGLVVQDVHVGGGHRAGHQPADEDRLLA